MLELAMAAPGGNMKPPVLLKEANDIANLHAIKTIFRLQRQQAILRLFSIVPSMTGFEGN